MNKIKVDRSGHRFQPLICPARELAPIHWLRNHNLHNLFEINESHQIVRKGDAAVGSHVHTKCVIVEFINSNLLCIRKWIKGEIVATCCSAPNKVPAEIFIAWSALLLCLYAVSGYGEGRVLFRLLEIYRAEHRTDAVSTAMHITKTITIRHAVCRLVSRLASHTVSHIHIYISVQFRMNQDWMGENNANRVKCSMRFNWFMVIVFHYVSLDNNQWR